MSYRVVPDHSLSSDKTTRSQSLLQPNGNGPHDPLIELGVTGLQRMGGFVHEEFLQQLRGNKAAKVYREMRDNDPLVAAMLFAIEMLMRQVDWKVQEAGQDSVDIEAAEFLESCMNDMSMTWEDLLSEIMSMLPFGWAYHEVCYKQRRGPDGESKSKYDDGKIGWRKMPIRSQESLLRWEFDEEDGSVIGMWQQAPPHYTPVLVPISKALLFRTSVHKGNPEGRSVLRGAYRPWYFKKRIEETEAIGIERDLVGLPMLKVDPMYLDPNASNEVKAVLEEYKKMVVNVRRDKQEGLIIPSVFDHDGRPLFEFSLLSSGGGRQFDTGSVITRYDQRIAMTVMADFILLGQEAVGSFALASSKTSLFAVALGAWMDMIADVFNNYAVPPLFALNGMRLDKLPKIVHGDIESPDLSELSNFVSGLVSAGVPLFPDPKLEDHLRAVAKLPIPTDQERKQKEDDALVAKEAEDAMYAPEEESSWSQSLEEASQDVPEEEPEEELE